MDKNDIVLLICGAIGLFVWGQMEASGNIGNRAYSIWYETHCLIEKRGIFNLIYFKPKHFERYTLYEVVSFFSSYLFPILLAGLAILCFLGKITSFAFSLVVISAMCLCLLGTLIVVIINDIGSHRDEKKKFYLESGERDTTPVMIPESWIPEDNTPAARMAVAQMQMLIEERCNPYFTQRNLWTSYHIRLEEAGKNEEKRNRVNLDYIEYFKNIEHLVVVRENKSGSLQLRIQK